MWMCSARTLAVGQLVGLQWSYTRCPHLTPSVLITCRSAGDAVPLNVPPTCCGSRSRMLAADCKTAIPLASFHESGRTCAGVRCADIISWLTTGVRSAL